MNVSGNPRDSRAETVPIYGTGDRVYDRPGYVYFIASETLIKIGFSGAPGVRLKALRSQTGEPLKILAHAVGWITDEAALHKKFAHLRDHQEWFRPEQELYDVIAAVKDGKSLTELLKPEVIADAKSAANALLKKIPTTPVEFDRWANAECGAWPAHVQINAYHANEELHARRSATPGSIQKFRDSLHEWALEAWGLKGLRGTGKER